MRKYAYETKGAFYKSYLKALLGRYSPAFDYICSTNIFSEIKQLPFGIRRVKLSGDTLLSRYLKRLSDEVDD